ncbi:MAG: lipid-transfer protein, partial [Acidimicrobiales bacterium]|nr:lipid-transfer protein [Acidimicrobiales bacterium]
RPAWITGLDHRIDPHTIGARDLTSIPSAALAGQKAGISNGKVDVAELDAPFTYTAPLLTEAFGLGADVSINPSGGTLNGHTMMAAGLMNIAKVASQIHNGDVDRGLAHASSGPLLQQNLACVLEAK